MESIPNNFLILLRRIGLLLFIYFIGRFLFLAFNFGYFSSLGVVTICSSFFYGLRYDITAIVICNIVFISLHILPFRFFYNRIYQSILMILFLVVNIPFLLFNCIDIGLFRFTGKRSGSEIISIMSFGDDFVNTAPKMMVDFWYLLLTFFFLIFILVRWYPKIQKDVPLQKVQASGFFHSTAGKIFLFLLFFGMTFIGFRGGIQYKPLNILSASRYGTGRTSILVLNTPFTILKTFGKSKIEDLHWMTTKEAHALSPVMKRPDTSGSFKQKNVVVIILESFGKEYIGSLNSFKGYTPFLDSLIGKSLVFTNAYANGKRSIEGIPAVVAGLPALMTEPFISSAYSGNSVTSLPSLLKQKGYTSTFFHGGTDGTMGFDNFARLAGFDHYFGRTEYNNDADFDGSWGIFDEPFLKRSATEMEKMKSPFFATIFTISSHHPYTIPERYSKVFPEGTLPIHQSIGYADHSLRQFFSTVSKMPFYNNTLFVITADHTALSEYPFYRSRVGLFSIPVIYFSPGDSLLHGINTQTTQQIDILPSVMDYLDYDLPYFAFGNSVFNKTNGGSAVNFLNETYQLISDGYSFTLDTTGNNSLYKFVEDSTYKNDLSLKDTATGNKMEKKLRSFVQNFNHAIIYNEMK